MAITENLLEDDRLGQDPKKGLKENTSEQIQSNFRVSQEDLLKQIKESPRKLRNFDDIKYENIQLNQDVANALLESWDEYWMATLGQFIKEFDWLDKETYKKVAIYYTSDTFDRARNMDK